MNLAFECINSAVNRLTCVRRNRHCLTRLAVFLFGFGTIAVPIIATNAQGVDAYIDDTHGILQTSIGIQIVGTDFGYDSYLFRATVDGERLALDTRNAKFIVANSKNPNPTVDLDCDTGSLPINRYPFKVYDADITWVVGGLMNGEIPQESDWEPTYCNSAGVIFKNAASSAVDGLRITSAWDAIRAGPDSSGLTIRNNWISNVRDDVLENDDFLSVTFEDNLVDGTFQGISVHSGGDISTDTGAKIHVYGNVIRIREYLYKGRQQYGALFKNEPSSPASIIRNTVVAVDHQGGRTFSGYWERSWSKIEDCSNNLFLWLSDEPISSSVSSPPSCFRVLTGEEARAEWALAKKNWIDCHPKVSRTPADPVSNPEQCVKNRFGGYSRYDTVAPLPPTLLPQN